MDIFSAEECLLIAQKTLQEKVVVLDYHLEAGSSELIGYMGEYYTFFIEVETVEDKVKHSLVYFIKSLPRHNEPQKAECERKGVFQKETTVYRELLPQVQKYATKKLFPVCYYSRQDVIVLEDLNKNYRHLKSSEGYSLQHYKLVLEHLAEMHAASLAWEHAEKFNIEERYGKALIELHLSSGNTWYISGLKSIIYLAKRHKDYQTPEAQRFIDEKLYDLLIKSEDLVKPSRNIRNVLCHRDTWDRNIFFAFPSKEATIPTSCCIVDFQLTNYCSPTLDVLFLLYIVAPASVRNDIYEECLEHYYNSLQSKINRLQLGESVISKENFLLDCQRNRLAALVIWALTEPLTKMSFSLSNRLRAEEPEKFDYYLNVDRSELYERVIEQQAGYEQTIMAPIKELVDYLRENEQLFG